MSEHVDSAFLAAERRDEILRLVRTEGKVRAADLALRFGVSVDTVRRDLSELADAGAVRRVHGGALPLPSPGPADFPARLDDEPEAKEAVAQAALRLVREDEVLALGGGATALAVARGMPDELSATVVTTSPDVASALAEHPRLTVDLIGGRLDASARTVTGPEALAGLARVRPDLFLLSVCTVHPSCGLAMRRREEADVARALVEASTRVAVLAHASKLGTTAPYPIGALEEVDALVTTAPPDETQPYEALGVQVIRP